MAARKARPRRRTAATPVKAAADTRRSVRTHTPLSPAALRRAADPSALDFATTAELDGPGSSFGQERALEALRFAVSMEHPGYNAFALGPSGVGKHATVEALLRGAAANRPVPPD
ncbi:MAG: AAA family ATPase [Deltaproteobacteria bacterium]|nr:AAA family ATPase [Deltaproteobacteria bacterium]